MHIKTIASQRGAGQVRIVGVGRAVPDKPFAAMPFAGDAWRLSATGAALALPQVPAVFATGNGFIGVRGPGEPEGAPRVYLNGVFEKVQIRYHEASFGFARSSDARLSVADGTRLLIRVDGDVLGPPVAIQLDMRRGGLVERFVLHGVEVRVERLVSMTRTAIVAARVTVATVDAHRVSVKPGIVEPPGGVARADDEPYDPRVSPDLEASPWRPIAQFDDVDGVGRIDALPASGFVVAVVAGHPGIAAAGAETMIDLVVAYAAGRGGDPLADARGACVAAAAAGFAQLAAEQAQWFAAHWERCWFALPDDSVAEASLRHGMFQLVQAAGRDGTTSIAAKGQTGEGYEGHVFWDADLYVLPALALTRPDIARAMLAWRIAGLDAARGNARAMGQATGALYPWRTIAGGECSSFFPAGAAQYHINADIAYALRLYVDATGDRSILAEGGAAMLVETARIWLEIGFHDPARGDAFVINRVTGPDEYSALVDNNLYTNLMAAEHLRSAAAVGGEAGLLGADEPAKMLRAADRMMLASDADRGIYAQDEGFFRLQRWPFETTPASAYPLLLHQHPLNLYRHAVAKQADAVLALALLRDRFEPAMRARMLDVYEDFTVHDSTLSASAFATAAANVGDSERAYRYWRASVLTDLCDLFGNSHHGLHMAALAGGWTALAMGFAGLRATPMALSFAPITVPRLGRYGFRAAFRDSVIEVAVDTSAATFRLVSGAPVPLEIHGETVMLAGTPICRELAR